MRDSVGRRPPPPAIALVELPGYYSRQLSGPPAEREASQRPSPPQSPSLNTCLVMYDAWSLGTQVRCQGIECPPPGPELSRAFLSLGGWWSLGPSIATVRGLSPLPRDMVSTCSLQEVAQPQGRQCCQVSVSPGLPPREDPRSCRQPTPHPRVLL